MAVVRKPKPLAEPHTIVPVRKVPRVSILRSVYSEQTVGRLIAIDGKVHKFIHDYPGHKAEIVKLGIEVNNLNSYLTEESFRARADAAYRIYVEKQADLQLKNLNIAYKRITGT